MNPFAWLHIKSYKYTRLVRFFLKNCAKPGLLPDLNVTLIINGVTEISQRTEQGFHKNDRLISISAIKYRRVLQNAPEQLIQFSYLHAVFELVLEIRNQVCFLFV